MGGPGLLLAQKYAVELVGIDIEAALVDAARRRARERNLETKTDFRVLTVTPGLPAFPDELSLPKNLLLIASVDVLGLPHVASWHENDPIAAARNTRSPGP